MARTPSPIPRPSGTAHPHTTHARATHPRAVRAGIALALSAALVAVLAAPVAAGTTSGGSATKADRTVVGTGIGRIRGVPDVLTMTMGVTSRGRTVGEALDRNNAAAAKVVDVLVDGGVDKRDLQTSNFSIGPVRDDRSGNITGYQASNVLTVTLRDLGRAGKLIDRAAEAGGDDVVVRGVQLGFDDTSDLVARARADAVKRARSQAEQLARAAGVELGEVLTINESSRDLGPVLAAPETTDRAQALDVTIEPGTEELTVYVTIVFALR